MAVAKVHCFIQCRPQQGVAQDVAQRPEPTAAAQILQPEQVAAYNCPDQSPSPNKIGGQKLSPIMPKSGTKLAMP